MIAESEQLPLKQDLDGVIRIGGTRVPLDTVVTVFEQGATAEEIVQRFPTLDLADVYFVIGYYLRHRTDSLEDHWDQTHEVQFEVRAKRRYRVTLDPDVYARIEAQALARGILPETLVNLWLSERLQETK